MCPYCQQKPIFIKWDNEGEAWWVALCPQGKRTTRCPYKGWFVCPIREASRPEARFKVRMAEKVLQEAQELEGINERREIPEHDRGVLYEFIKTFGLGDRGHIDWLSPDESEAFRGSGIAERTGFRESWEMGLARRNEGIEEPWGDDRSDYGEG